MVQGFEFGGFGFFIRTQVLSYFSSCLIKVVSSYDNQDDLEIRKSLSEFEHPLLGSDWIVDMSKFNYSTNFLYYPACTTSLVQTLSYFHTTKYLSNYVSKLVAWDPPTTWKFNFNKKFHFLNPTFGPTKGNMIEFPKVWQGPNAAASDEGWGREKHSPWGTLNESSTISSAACLGLRWSPIISPTHCK